MDNVSSPPPNTSSTPENAVHFMSFSHTSGSSGKRKILISIIVLLAIIFAVILYSISQKQSLKSKAACNIEHMPPYNVLPGCLDDDASTDCPAPADGACKPKGNPCGASTCWECRDERQGLIFIQFRDGKWGPCGGENPTPTTPPPPKCPYTCVPLSQAQNCRPPADAATASSCGPDQMCCQPIPPTPTKSLPPSPTPTKPANPTPTTPQKVCEPPKKCIPEDQIPEDQLKNCEVVPIDKPGANGCKNIDELCCLISPTPTLPPSSCPVPNQVDDLQIFCPSCKQ